MTPQEAINTIQEKRSEFINSKDPDKRYDEALCEAVKALVIQIAPPENLRNVIDTLETWIEHADDEYDREEMGRVAGLKSALMLIRKIPKDERPKGHWIEGEKTPGYTKWSCSECGKIFKNPAKPWYDFCPKCGAEIETSIETN